MRGFALVSAILLQSKVAITYKAAARGVQYPKFTLSVNAYYIGRADCGPLALNIFQEP